VAARERTGATEWHRRVRVLHAEQHLARDDSS